MSNNFPDTAARTRERVILFLVLLTSDEIRQACATILPPDKLAFAWCRLWFDEIYVPSTRYLDGIKGDRVEDAVARFRAAFSDAELAALERFHRFLELRIDMLSEANREQASFPQNDAWDAVVRDASYLLEELNPDPDLLQNKLTAAVRILTREDPARGSTDVLREALNPPPGGADYT